MSNKRHWPLAVMMVVAVSCGLGGWGLGHHNVKAAGTNTGVTTAMQSAIELQTAFAQAAERVKPATVSILTDRGSGSGFVINANGTILTNNHVVDRAKALKVRLPDRDEPLVATLVGRDEASDVAVLSVKAPGPLPVAQLGDSDAVDIGNWAIAIGSPMELDQTVTIGHISATGRVTRVTGENSAQDYLQTDAAINPGNSGGPLVNIVGQVIGLNNHILSESGASNGLGFAVPINTAKLVAKQLLEKGKVTRSRLGLEIRGVTDAELAKLPGGTVGRPVYIDKVSPGGPGAAAGVQPGDIVLAVDGHRLRDGADFVNRVQLTPPGGSVRLSVVRAGQPLDLDARPAALPVTRPKPQAIGARLLPVTPRMVQRMHLKTDSGLLIVQVVENGPADRAGIEAGQVLSAINGQPTRTIDEFVKAWRAAVASPDKLTATVDGKTVELSE